MKSQSELNWVFILIIGAIILVFFITFAFKYKSLQEEKISIEILNNLDNSLTSLKSSPYNTFDKINLPKEIEITCNEIKINDKSFKTNNLLFSQNKLKNKILIYYRNFKLPFKIADFYLITDVNTKFNLVHDQSTKEFVNELIKDLPEDLRLRFSSSDLKKNENNLKNIEIKNLNNDKIKVNNFDLDLNKDLVYAAIFSENFPCSYNKIKQEIVNSANVYQNKINTLKKNNCNYYSFNPYLDKLKTFDLTSSISIEALNNELAQKNCPTLY